MKTTTRTVIAGLVLATALTGAAQAEPLNIYSASKQQEVAATVENVRHGGRHYYRRHRSDAGAALAIGAIGAIAAGAAIAASRDREYYDDGYYYDGPPPRRYYRDYCDVPNRPKHYPAPQGC